MNLFYNFFKISCYYDRHGSTICQYMPYFVYILRTSGNTLYIGQTNNLEKRLKEHKSKSAKSAKYVRYFDSVDLVYKEGYTSRSEAMKREAELKSWPKVKKEAIIAGNSENLLE